MTDKLCDEALKESGISQKDINRLIKIAIKASKLGGDVLNEYYGNISTINNKGRMGDLVTNADLEAEELILKYLNSQTPEISILAEESGLKGSLNSLTWCIDPLDGTTNFAHGFPFFATSIGLIYKGKPILGSITIPFFKETYWAAPGHGSFCNDKEIKVSSTTKLIDSLLVTGFSYDRHNRLDNNYAEFCWLTHRSRGVRRAGAASIDLAFMAAGRLDGYWERGLSQWDIAAGIPIVEMAGGVISTYKNNNFDISSGRILACTPAIKDELINVLNSVVPLKGESFGAPEVNL